MKVCWKLVCLACGIVIFFSGYARATLMGSADISSAKLNPTTYRYDITLHNTSSDTTIGTYWFGWNPGQNFMQAIPSNIVAPSGWHEDTISHGSSDGYGIEFEADTLLPAGASIGSFQFDSTETPGEISGPSPFFDNPPESNAFIYSMGAFSDNGLEITARAIPEPAVVGLLVISLAGLAAKCKFSRA